jgi:hypothetical protein
MKTHVTEKLQTSIAKIVPVNVYIIHHHAMAHIQTGTQNLAHANAT